MSHTSNTSWLFTSHERKREIQLQRINRSEKEKRKDHLKDLFFWSVLLSFFVWVMGGVKGVMFVGKLLFVALHVAALLDIDLDRVSRQKAVNGMLSAIDANSGSVPVSVSESFYRDGNTDRSDSGMLLRDDNGAVIASILEDGAADKAGFKIGDRIKWIFKDSNAVDYAAATRILDNLDAFGLSEALESFKIGVERGDNVIVASLSLEKWKATKAYLIDIKDDIPLIGLTSFTDGATNDVANLLEEILAQHDVEEVIFDLRGNPGGMMTEAINLSGLFVSKGTVVSRVSSRRLGDNAEVTTSEERFPQIKKVGVLQDNQSASASEFFAAFIRDEGLGPIAGETSYGKGSAQIFVDIGDIDPFRITVAHFTGPAGDVIDGVGVNPTMEVEMNEAGHPDWPGLIDRLRATISDG